MSRGMGGESVGRAEVGKERVLVVEEHIWWRWSCGRGQRGGWVRYSIYICTMCAAITNNIHASDIRLKLVMTLYHPPVCMYILQLPFQLVLRVWDSMMFEGEKVLIAMSLVLLKINSSKIEISSPS